MRDEEISDEIMSNDEVDSEVECMSSEIEEEDGDGEEDGENEEDGDNEEDGNDGEQDGNDGDDDLFN